MKHFQIQKAIPSVFVPRERKGTHWPWWVRGQVLSTSQEAVGVKRFCKPRWVGNSRHPTDGMEACPQQDDHAPSHPTPGSLTPPATRYVTWSKTNIYCFTKFLTLTYCTWSSKSLHTFFKRCVFWSPNYWLLSLWWYVGLLLFPTPFPVPSSSPVRQTGFMTSSAVRLSVRRMNEWIKGWFQWGICIISQLYLNVEVFIFISIYKVFTRQHAIYMMYLRNYSW